MTAIDIRNENWDTIRARVCGMRLCVLEAWRAHGPGTTAAIAARAGISLLTFRPRTTELLQLGFLRLKGQVTFSAAGNATHEGVYEALDDAGARELFEAMQERAKSTAIQPDLF